MSRSVRPTRRGVMLALAGLAATIVGTALGTIDIVRVGIVLLALVLLAIAFTARATQRMSIRRTVQPARIEAGQATTVTLTIGNQSRTASSRLVARDLLPAALGESPRFTLTRLRTGASMSAKYRIAGAPRGNHLIGPLTIEITDAFGLARLTRRFRDPSPLTVTPAVEPLGPIGWVGTTGAGRTTLVAARSTGEDDVLPREYRHGDDLRRVHWPATARAGELMVRREEREEDNTALLCIDPRHGIHRGSGPRGSFEWTISAAASIGLLLIEQKYKIEVASNLGERSQLILAAGIETGEPLDSERLLDALTAAEPSSGRAGFDRRTLQSSTAGLIVLITGPLGSGATPLAGSLAEFAHGIGIVLDPFSWGAPGRREAGAEPTAAALSAAGWQTGIATAGRSVASVWETVTSGWAETR